MTIGSVLTQGAIGRLDSATSADETGKIAIVQNNLLQAVTPAQTVNGVSNPSFSGTVTQGVGKSDFNQMVSLTNIPLFTVGTWQAVRIAQGNFAVRHTAADETAIIVWDITPEIRTTTSKGFQLVSLDLAYTIGTAALDAHTLTLSRTEYANNTAVSVNAIAVTGTLATATQANPYVTNITVDSALFNNTANAKYILELTVNAATTTAYDLNGLGLNYTRNDL